MMRKQFLSVLAGAALVTLASQPSPAQQGFSCPNLKADEPHAATIKKQLSTYESYNQQDLVSSVVSSLRAQGVNATELVNDLIATYCPLVAAKADLSDAQKARAVKSFASLIAPMAYGFTVEDIILNVDFPPSVMNQINAKAKQAGVTPAEWVRGLVESSLK